MNSIIIKYFKCWNTAQQNGSRKLTSLNSAGGDVSTVDDSDSSFGDITLGDVSTPIGTKFGKGKSKHKKKSNKERELAPLKYSASANSSFSNSNAGC